MTNIPVRNEMTLFQKQYCLNMLDKLQKHPISELFLEQPNYTDKRFSGYTDKPKKPMDLKKVREKIKDNQYKCINEWGTDVRLVWSNIISCYPSDSPLTKMAQTLSSWFEERWKDYPRTEQEQWVQKLKKVQDSFSYLKDNFPLDKTFIPEKEDNSNKAEKTDDTKEAKE